MKAYKKKLKNGLRIITVPMKGAPTVTVMAMTMAGSGNEEKRNNGISHFLEHMMFKGTPSRPSAMAIAHELDALGAENNAFTSEECTAYYAKGRKKHVNKFLDVISDVYQNPLFPEAEMEKERGVIIEEINLYQDLPMRQVHEVLTDLMYGDQPAGWTILGPKENIKRMQREDFLSYHRNHYVARNTVVIIAGGIKNSEIVREVEKAFRGIRIGKSNSRLPTKEKQSSPQVKIKNKKSDQSHLVLGFRSFNSKSKEMPVVEVLSTILGRGMSSRLFQKLREEMGVCYYVRADHSPKNDTGVFKVSAGVDNKRVFEVVGEILRELKRIKKEPVGEKELSKAKEYIIGNFLMGLEGSDDIAGFYISQEIAGIKYKTPNEWIEKIKKVSESDIRRVAKDIFKNNKINLAIIGPFTKRDSTKFKKVLKV